MSDAIVEEFARELAALARDFEGDPRGELDALWVIGIEREAIVTVAYRRAVIEARLAKMPIDDEARAVVGRAIRWAWRDEHAHTLWVRGALMRRSELTQRARALTAQIEGWIGGWVASRQNHLSWAEAPVTRLIAEGVEALGVASGRIPKAVREALHFNTFADFCRFNRSAETTAAMAWRRMHELSLAIGAAIGANEEAAGFEKMAGDEERHARIFAILSKSFDERDHLLCTAQVLRDELQGVGQRFVARPDAERPAWQNPLGKGATVVVRQGPNARDVAAEVLEAMGMRGILLRFAPRDRPLVVALKTSFMLLADRSDPSTAVSIDVLRGVIEWLRDRGAIVRTIDARNLYDRFHANRSVAEVARYLGLPDEVVDADLDQVPHPYVRGLGQDSVARAWRDADVRVLLGKLRSHPTATALLSLEAAEGLGERVDDHLFVERRSDREMSVLMVLDALPPHAALLDAFEHVPDGLLGVLGTKRPLHPRRIYGSTDAVALDAVVCRHIGGEPTRDGTLTSEAFDWFGDPRGATVVDGDDAPIEGFRLPDHSARTAFLSTLARPIFTHASARGELFLPDFDEAAFPPIRPAPVLLRAARAAVRHLVDGGDRQEEHAGLLPTSVLRVGDGAVRIARLGSGAPIVLLHGYPETLQLWSLVAPRLAQRGREVIAFDWPGLGYSSGVAGPADPDALCEQLREVLGSAGLGRVDLVAADMGAPPALVFAARHPERVGALVVLSSLLFGDEATSVEISVMRRAGLAGAAFRVAPSIVYARCKQTFLPEGDSLAPDLDRDFSIAFQRTEVRERLVRMCADYERALPRLPERYWKIRRPVRLLWAEHDGHFPPRQAERLCEILPEASAVVIPGARHWMPISRAGEVADAIGSFLGEVR